jgi:hypothetical protein
LSRQCNSTKRDTRRDRRLDSDGNAWENENVDTSARVFAMTLREQVLHEALALPPEDRAFVAAALERSLVPASPDDVPDAITATSPDAISGDEFLRELERRSEAYRTGATTARPAADVLADQRQRQVGERTK